MATTTTSPFLTYDLQPDYKHEELADSKRNLRLLELHPIAEAQILSGSVHEFERTAAPTYVALSYEWGPAKADLTVNVDGREFRVRQNLFNILTEYARRISEKSYLFVDAICIDQSNLAERNAQVSVMGDIFASAIEVSAWLSDPFPGLKGLFDLANDTSVGLLSRWSGQSHARINIKCRGGDNVHAVYSKHQVSAEVDRSSLPSGGHIYVCKAGGPTSSMTYTTGTSDSFLGISESLERPFICLRCALLSYVHASYWSRAWIIQEVILGRKASMNCGKSSTSLVQWNALWTSLYYIGCWSSKLKGPYQGPDNLSDAVMATPAFQLTTIIERLQQIHRAGEATELSLAYLMSFSRRQKCADIRDRVYSILGLARGVLLSEGRSIEVSYQCSNLGLFLKCIVANDLTIETESPIPALIEALGLQKRVELAEIVRELTEAGIPNGSFDLRLMFLPKRFQQRKIDSETEFEKAASSESGVELVFEVNDEPTDASSAQDSASSYFDISRYRVELFLLSRCSVKGSLQWDVLRLQAFRTAYSGEVEKSIYTEQSGDGPLGEIIRRGKILPAYYGIGWAQLRLDYADVLEILFSLVEFESTLEAP
jgi:hypothetical protein